MAVAIVGGGIGGLTTAMYLARAGQRVVVLEASDRWGGSIVTGQGNGWLWEEGPNSFTPNGYLMELIEQLGLGEQVVWADPQLPRFVWWGNRLHPIPSSPPALLSSSLLSPLGKLRALVGALGFVPPAMHSAESVADFFRRHLGREVLEQLVAPFVSGVYAGDPQQLGVASAFRRVWEMEQLGGGLLAGFLLARKKMGKTPGRLGQLGSFRGGLAELPQAIVTKLRTLGVSLHQQWQVIKLSYDGQAYHIHAHTPAGAQVITAAKVVLAIPAYSCAQVLAELSPIASGELGTIYYPPVACVALGYPLSALRQSLVGFGHLIPRGQGIRTLGTIWASSLFPDRAPAGYQLLLNFIGGSTDPQIAQLTTDEIVTAVDQDLRQTLLQPSAPEPIVLAVHLWQRAIPQYDLHHVERMAVIAKELSQYPHLYLVSNFTDGVAVGDCVRRGIETANQLLSSGQ